MNFKQSTDSQLLKFACAFSQFRNSEASIRAAHAEITKRLALCDTTELRMAQAQAAQSIAGFDAEKASNNEQAFMAFIKAGYKVLMLSQGARLKLFGGALDAFAEEQATRMMAEAMGD